MRHPHALLAALLAAGSIASCAPAPSVPGMIAQGPRAVAASAERLALASVAPAPGRHRVPVVFVKGKCSDSTPTIFTAPDGSFLGAVAPGDAAFLSVPDDLPTLVAFSAVDVSAPRGTWFEVSEVVRPSSVDVDSGLLLRSSRAVDGQGQCNGGDDPGLNARIRVATGAELTSALAEAPVRWLTVQPEGGQAWLDAHRPRMDELLGRSHPAPAPRVLTRTSLP